MSLDMYAYAIKASLIKDAQQVDIRISDALGITAYTEDGTDEERCAHSEMRDAIIEAKKESGEYDHYFAYWRKFNNLHGWMQDLYNTKGGTDPEFNCATLRLMPEDIDKLEEDAATLKPRAGYFFGCGEDMSPTDFADVVAFVAKCRKAFSKDMAVIYDSWW